MAADAAGFIDGLGLRSVDILGHSMGGEIAQLIALDRPDLVRRVIDFLDVQPHDTATPA